MIALIKMGIQQDKYELGILNRSFLAFTECQLNKAAFKIVHQELASQDSYSNILPISHVILATSILLLSNDFYSRLWICLRWVIKNSRPLMHWLWKKNFSSIFRTKPAFHVQSGLALRWVWDKQIINHSQIIDISDIALQGICSDLC